MLVADGGRAEWKTFDVSVTPEYPVGNTAEAFGAHFEVCTFAFAPIDCRGIRLIGQAGGSANFIGIAELEVYGVEQGD